MFSYIEPNLIENFFNLTSLFLDAFKKKKKKTETQLPDVWRVLNVSRCIPRIKHSTSKHIRIAEDWLIFLTGSQYIHMAFMFQYFYENILL